MLHFSPAQAGQFSDEDRSGHSVARVVFGQRAEPSLRPGAVKFAISISVVLIVVLLGHVALNPRIDEVTKGLYIVLFCGLYYCCLAYLINRYGAAKREVLAAAAPSSAMPPEDGPSVTVLVPSFREERRVLLATVLSAALARYGDRRVVVLLDDPPFDAARPSSLKAVEDARAWLAEPMAGLRVAEGQWQERKAAGLFDAAAEGVAIAATYRSASAFLDGLAERLKRDAEAEFVHVDGFLIESVVLSLSRHYSGEADAIAAAELNSAMADRHYQRLARLFCDDISVFERKQFINLPHAANKAMNLNAYLGLMGNAYRFESGREGTSLVRIGASEPADLIVPEPDYVLTLDADSVILPDYLVALMGVIEVDPAIGVIQTPYRAFPGSRSAVERVAGATTDMQYLVHQGSSHFSAGFWVGANALLRRSALKAIATEQRERGHAHQVFIQDRTVIEDTGSTIDLLGKGYRVHNHFESLAYSATPADFGSLAVQRERWSNGGLIIFPDLWRQVGFGGLRRRGLELVLRSHYLLSPVVGNTAVFLLMILLSTDTRNLLLMPLAMVPYFVIYGLDLRRSGYRFADIFSVSALNLMLLPVGFAGILASIMQMATGRKGRFRRTPKVAGRTRVHWFHIVFSGGLVALMGFYLFDGIASGAALESIFPAMNLALLGYGFVRFIGPVQAVGDLAAAAFEPFRPLLSTQRTRRHLAAGALGLVASLVPLSLGPAFSGQDSSALLLRADAATPLDQSRLGPEIRPLALPPPRERPR
ncbi:Glycosyl transferase family group 2 [Devosia enhydra]|uniref:Glycosyl transferase family group 2 n=1 Tax=Devosia enhydra TaxID=665118 RepID=A0A1K2I2Z4_9HYPH|nr:glycosyltransferase family 2 protein [Devosia enhydra]SFZ86705.1 Glycosyl transferase family group 2 [Devosia enhydra]